MKREIKIEWKDEHWCSNTIEVDVPDDIPADQVNDWIEDHIWDFEMYEGFSTDHLEMVENSVEIEVFE